MSDRLFPLDLPGLKIAVTRTTMHRTTVLTAASGREYRARWYSEPRHEWKISYEMLRQSAPSGADELQLVVDFYNDHAGSFDSFLFDCPVDGKQRRVRFKNDKLDIDRFLHRYWEVKSIELIEVV